MMQVHVPLLIGESADRLDYARQVLRAEAAALEQVAQRLGDSFLESIDILFKCPGRIGLTGIGKSADIAQKIAGTLNSTGSRSYVIDATRAMHGDLGMVHPDDVVIVLSQSGESEEIVRLLGPLRGQAMAIVALTCNGRSTLSRSAHVSVDLGNLEEACPLGLAPSTSTTAMVAVGDALAFVLCRMRRFTREDFARYHPAGSLGRKLLRVEAVMRQGADLRVARAEQTVREVFAQVRRGGRRSGAVMLTDDEDRLCGLFTDSDLARLFEMRRDQALDRPIALVMTKEPFTIAQGSLVTDAVDILRKQRISELPVVDQAGRPVGMIDITDVIGLVPAEEAEAITLVA